MHFASDVLGSVLWRRQRDIMRAVATKPLVAVKACHASGKTYLAARFALWWPITIFRDVKVARNRTKCSTNEQELKCVTPRLCVESTV